MCTAPANCPLLFHLLNVTPAQATTMPESLALELLNVLQPPTGQPWHELEWRNEFGMLDRAYDLPAVIKTDGTKLWFRNGQPHRDNDKPARLDADSTQRWYQDGQLHRVNDLPAIVYADGTLHWCMHGKLHRAVDSPPLSTPMGSSSGGSVGVCSGGTGR